MGVEGNSKGATVPPAAGVLPGDICGWQAVQRCAQITQSLQCQASVLQRQLQSAYACNAAIAMDLLQAAEGNGPPPSPYEAAVVCRDAAYETHLRDADLLHVELLTRQQAAVHGSAFFRWLSEIDATSRPHDDRVGQAVGRLPRGKAANLMMPEGVLHAAAEQLQEVPVLWLSLLHALLCRRMLRCLEHTRMYGSDGCRSCAGA